MSESLNARHEAHRDLYRLLEEAAVRYYQLSDISADRMVAYSTAVSLKRIADVLEFRARREGYVP